MVESTVPLLYVHNVIQNSLLLQQLNYTKTYIPVQFAWVTTIFTVCMNNNNLCLFVSAIIPKLYKNPCDGIPIPYFKSLKPCMLCRVSELKPWFKWAKLSVLSSIISFGSQGAGVRTQGQKRDSKMLRASCLMLMMLWGESSGNWKGWQLAGVEPQCFTTEPQQPDNHNPLYVLHRWHWNASVAHLGTHAECFFSL